MSCLQLTEPEFAGEISESILVVSPVAIEIFTAVFASLKHLQYEKRSDLGEGCNNNYHNK